MSEEINLIKDPEEIRLNEDQEIQQILGSPPGWILRWGIVLVALVTVVLLFLSWIIKYPDIIQAPVVITTENPPIRVFTRSSGKIQKLLVQSQQNVKSGDLLAVMETPANFNDVETLEKFLEPFTNSTSEATLQNLQLPQQLNLGTLQNSFSQVAQQLDELRYVSQKSNITDKVNTIQGQIRQLELLNESLKTQESTLQKVVSLARQNFERNQELLQKEVASQLEVENAEAAYLQNKRQLEAMKSEMINNQVRIEQLTLQIIQTKQGQKDQQFPRLYEVQENIQRLKSEIQNWKQQFLIQAPIAGSIEMNKIWSANQFLNAAEEILTIIPKEVSNKTICKGYLPFNRSGKVTPGMTANIRFSAFPYQEFGVYTTTVRYISELPQTEGFLVELEMEPTIITSYQDTIPFRQEMQGLAHIITEDRRILDRIFDRIISAVKNKDESR